MPASTDLSPRPPALLPPKPRRRSALIAALATAWAGLACATEAAEPPAIPAYDHIVIVVLENRSADAGGDQRIWGNPALPFLNGLADDAQYGVKFTNAWASETPYRRIPRGSDAPLSARPSQPNYLYLFSGSHQGVRPDWFQDETSPYRGKPLADAEGNRLDFPGDEGPVGIGNRLIPAARRPFTTANLGAALREGGQSFLTFSQSLPHPFWDESGDPNPLADFYRRKHNPAINWIGFDTLAGSAAVPEARRRFLLPPEVNLGFEPTTDPQGRRWRGFLRDADGQPLRFEDLPTVALVVPDEQHNAHSASLGQADAWLREQLGGYAEWARTHNSLLIVTFDEDGATDTHQGSGYRWGRDRVATLMHGAHLKPGRYGERIDALNLLATVLHSQKRLARFRQDFGTTCPDDAATCQRQAANLRPILDVFGAGPALAELPPTRD